MKRKLEMCFCVHFTTLKNIYSFYLAYSKNYFHLCSPQNKTMKLKFMNIETKNIAVLVKDNVVCGSDNDIN